MKSGNKIKISQMVRKGANYVELEMDSIRSVRDYLIRRDFVMDGSYQGEYFYEYYYEKEGVRYCLFGNWYMGEMAFRRVDENSVDRT